MKRFACCLLFSLLISEAGFDGNCLAADWPMWRYDAGRTASSPESLPDPLHLRWVKEFPKLRPAYREARLQFDAGYEPIVLGKTMFVASSETESVVALDTDTGEERWEFFAEGPIRLAPAASQDRIYFGSDDGWFYCVDAKSGRLLWKFQAVPSGRKILGNARMISLWPIRGGAAVQDGKVYFAAGVWPMEGVFIYCLDATSGEVIWRNDECSFIYGTQPHAAEALGGVTPQGYLVIAGEELIVPCGQALPARLDLKTGKLISFELPKPGRQPGGWFTSVEARRGLVVMDREINRDLHEDKIYQGPGSPEVRSTITLAGNPHRFSDEWPIGKAKVHTLLAADGKLFIVDPEGRLYCFGSEKPESVQEHKLTSDTDSARNTNQKVTSLDAVLSQTKTRDGYAWIRGMGSSLPEAIGIIKAFRQQTDFHLVATDPNAELLNQLRKQERLNRERIALLVDVGKKLKLPPYFASLIYSEAAPTNEELNCLRPYGGVGCFAISEGDHTALKTQIEAAGHDEFTCTRTGRFSVIRRGALPGAANYTGGWSSPDERVRAPLGVLWFDDALGHFKRSPQPWFVDGVMVSYPKDWMEKHREGRMPPYDLLPPLYSDVYTGRLISEKETLLEGLDFPKRDITEPQPNQYRPPTQQDAWKPKQPILGDRVNPLTGETEPRAIPKSYGCDGGVDYGFLYTMRSGTPAFYDKRMESGTFNIAGPRSGCTNSIIPACGVLNVPYFYEGCTCSYPLPVGLALISLAPEHEQWSSWGPGSSENIRRVGINFGAPGDRMSPEGTLWLDVPNRGGPSPNVEVAIEPKTAMPIYHHSLFVEGGMGWPWVVASGIQGAENIQIKGLKPGTATVRLYFSDPENEQAGQRIFDVLLDENVVEKNLDVAQVSGGRMRGMVRSYPNIQISQELSIGLKPHKGQTLLNGVEIIPAGDPVDEFPEKSPKE